MMSRFQFQPATLQRGRGRGGGGIGRAVQVDPIKISLERAYGFSS